MVSVPSTTWQATRARPALIGIAAAAPFLAGRLAAARNPDGIGGVAIPCPFRETTGLPCPICGSTRAVALAAHGDGGFVEYNAVVVVLLALVVLYGVVRLAAPRPAVPALARAETSFRRRPLRWLLVLGILAWTWTLSHRATIVG